MRISDWSSDVCSSDLAAAKAETPDEKFVIGQFTYNIAAAKKESGGSLEGKKIALVYHDSAYGKEPIATLEIGRASCRERVCTYVSISVVAVSLKKKRTESEAKLLKHQ